jgi:acetyltransferase AlgX (SGNH hydrolase-like protein)
MNSKIKNGILIFLFLTIFLPFIQQYFPFVASGSLYGFSSNASNTDLSWDTWVAGNYQEKKSKYLNDEAGFRPDLVRLNNQLDYSLFGKLNANGVVEGTNHSFYMSRYIDCYFGRDYVGYDRILEKMRKIKAISDTFARLGKSLIVIYSPAKEFMYPEYIPESFKTTPGSITNYESCLHIGDSLKINQVDFNGWFYSMKNSSKDLLYSKQGIHWSVYGSYLAADSLIKYVEHLRNIRMPHPVWTKIEHTSQPRDSDNDIEKILNLIYPVTTETFSYPVVSYTEDTTMVKPKVIYLGDSFIDMWLTAGIPQHINSDWQVWFWFCVVYCKDGNSSGSARKVDIPQYDWISAMNNTDCIVVMYTPVNLSVLGEGFIEKAYEYYFPEKR